MNKLKNEFEIGFKEGWGAFWSPFAGLFNSISATRHRHVSFVNKAPTNHHPA